MSQMFPKRPRAGATSGEERVFKSLRDAPGTEDWLVAHSLGIGRHVSQSEGEADFVVAIPGCGILVLEVKDWKAVRFAGNEWQTGDRSAARRIPPDDPRFEWDPAPSNPFSQAKGNAESIRGKIAEAAPRLDSVFVAGAVVFPMGDFPEADGANDFAWKSLDRRAFGDGAPPLAETLRNLFARIRDRVLGVPAYRALAERIRRCPFTPEVAGTAFQALLSDVYITDPRVYTREAASDRMKAWTKEQLNVLRYQLEDNPRIYVPSAAGTGKTLIAAEAVRRASRRHPDWRIGFFCFNDLLGGELADPGRFPRPAGGGRIDAGAIYRFAMETGGLPVAKFDKWSSKPAEKRKELIPAIREALEADGIPDGDVNPVPNFFNLLVPKRFLERARAKGPIFDYLVLDEVQDFLTRPFFDAFDALLKGGFRNGRWLVCGDYENQSVQNSPDRPVLNLLDPALDLRPSICRLTVNCRNPNGIAEEIAANVAPSPGYRETLRADEPAGATALPCDTSDPRAVSDAVGSAVRALRGERFADGEILVLFQSSERMAAWETSLAEHPIDGIKLRPFRTGRKPDHVRYMTVRRFKGLDHPAVILVLRPDATVPKTRRADENLGSSLVYVGMSRATFRLFLVAPKPFLADFRRATNA